MDRTVHNAVDYGGPLDQHPIAGSWLYAENIEGEWSALSDILMRKDSSIQSQISNLQVR